MSPDPVAPEGLSGSGRSVARGIVGGIPSFRRMIRDAIDRGEIDLDPTHAIECDDRDHLDLAMRLAQLELAADRVFEAFSRGAPPKRLHALFMELLEKGRAARRLLSLTGMCASGLCDCSACSELKKEGRPK